MSARVSNQMAGSVWTQPVLAERPVRQQQEPQLVQTVLEVPVPERSVLWGPEHKLGALSPVQTVEQLPEAVGSV